MIGSGFRTSWLAWALASFVLLGARAPAQVLSQLDPERVFVGQESVYTVLARDATKATARAPSVEGLSISLIEEGVTNVSSSIRIVNGRRSERSSADYVFRYSVRADAPGRFTLPAPVVEVDGNTRRGSPSLLVVEDASQLDQARLRVYCEPAAVVLGQEALLVVECDFKHLPASLETRDPLAMYDRAQSFFDDGVPPPSLFLPWIAQPPQGLGSLDLNEWVESRRVNSRRKGLRLSVDRGPLRGRFLESESVRDFRAADRSGRDADYRRYRFTLPIRGEVAGKFELPAATLEGKVVERKGSELRWRSIFLRSEPLRFEVLEPPREGRPEHYTGAVGSFRFSMEPPTPTSLKLGDPVFVTLLVQGQGFLKGVNFDLAALLSEKFRVESVGLTDSLPPGAERPPGFPDRPGRWRQWDYKLYPTSERVAEIPPIPFVWYDPDLREYQVRTTTAVPLSVRASGNGGSGVVVSPDAAEVASDVELVATSALSANVTDRNLLANQAPRLLPGGAVLGGLGLSYGVFALLLRRRRRLQDDPSVGRRQKAAGRAREGLRAALRASSLPDALGALRGYVADLDSRDEDALTGADLEAWFRGHDVPEAAVDRVRALSEAVELMSFGGGVDGGETQALLVGLDEVVREAEQRRRQRGCGTTSLLGLASAVMLAASMTCPAVTATVQDLDLFQQAESAAESGRWAEAADYYRRMLDDGYENGSVLYNLGNCSLRDGQLGAAIAAYRRAQLYLPGDANLEVNLQRALEARTRPLSLPEDRPWYDSLLFWRRDLSFAEERDISLGLAILAFLVAVTRRLLRRPPPGLSWALGLLLMGVALVGSSAVLDARELSLRRHGAVTQNQTVLKSGPGESYEPAYEQSVDQGSEFRVLAERDDWVKVLVGGKYEGWIPRGATALW